MSEIDPPKKGKASSYDDKFLRDLAETNMYKQWASQKGKVKTATTNAFDTERHNVAFDSSNQDEVPEGVNPLLDQFVNLNAEDPYEDIRASNQSGLEQLGKLPTRAAVKAIAEVAKIPGVIGGAIAAPFAEDGKGLDTIFNNEWIKTVDKINKNVNEDLLPVYTAKAVREGNLWDNISSTAFWATDGADGLGFLVGMMAPGMAFEYAGLGGKLVGTAANSKKLSWLTNMAGKAEEGTKVAKLMGLTGKNIDTGLAVMGNTLLEAGSEAKGVGDDLDAKKPQFEKAYLNSKDYQLKVNQKLANLDQQRRSGQISIEEYNEKSQSVSQETVDEAFNNQRALAMRDTFVSNVAILLGPNAIMHKAIWGKAAEKFEKVTEKGTKAVLNRAGKIAQRWGTAGLSEGFWEEGSQTTVENMFVNQALGGKLGKEDANSLDLVGEFTKEYVNTLTTVEGQKAIFLGGVLGGPMMSYQGRKQDVLNRKRTNAILDNIDSEILNFNTTFDNDIYKKKKDGSFKYKTDENGEETTERILDNKAVRNVAKNLNFTERQSALFDLAVKTGNTEVVDQIKKQAIFNLIMPAIHNGEAGLIALEKKLNQDAQFNEIVERDATSDSKDNSKTFVKETLESAKWLQQQKERFQDFSKDVIRIENKDATDENKEQFFEKLSASYLNSKYALRNAENALEKLEKKRNNAYEEEGISPDFEAEAQAVSAGYNVSEIEEKGLNKKRDESRLKLSENELIKSIEKEYTAKKLEIEAHKKDISEIWKGGSNIQESFDKFVGKEKAEEKATSDEAVAKAQKFIEDVESAETKDDLNRLLLPAHKSNEDFDREAEEFVLTQVANSIANDESTENLKANLDKLKSINSSSSKFDDIVNYIEDILSERIEAQEVLKSELAELLELHYEEAKKIEDTLDEYQKEVGDLIKIQQRLIKDLNDQDKSPKGRYAKLVKELIKEAEDQLDSINKDISKYNKAISDLQKDLKQINREIDYIYDRYNQTNQTEFESVQDIIDYLIKNSDLFKTHRQNIGKLLANKFGTERRIEELNEFIGSLEEYKDFIESVIKQYASMEGNIKKGTNMEDYKYLRDELIETSKTLFNAREELKESHSKVARLTKSIFDQQALDELSDEEKFWNDLDSIKKERIHPLAKNPVIAQKIKEKEDQLNEEEEINNEVEKNIQTELDEEQKINEPEEVVEINVPPVSEDETGDYSSESLPTQEDEEIDNEVTEGENMEEDVEELLDSPQVGAKVISTNMKTGKALYENLVPFVDYERTPRDKSKDIITFSVGDIGNDRLDEAYARLLKGTATDNDITFLKEKLPIKVTISYKDNGKDKTVYSFIEAQTSNIQNNQDSLDIFYKETMPLRSNIIDQALNNKSLDGITSNVIDQFPGVLKVEKRKEGESVKMNDIFDLQIFNGMTKAEKVDYFQKNTGFVNWEGNLVSTLNKDTIIKHNLGVKSKGEVFLMIPQNNGKMFPLKLNVSKINEEKSEAVYEIVRSLSEVSQSIGKKTSFQALTIGQFFKQLNESNPELSAHLQVVLRSEIGFVKRTAKGDERNESISRLLDLIIYHKSLNPKTGFNLSKDGNLTLGSLAHVLLDTGDFTHSLMITKQELGTPEAKEAIMKYVQYKRHNILITKDGPNQFVFNNPAYVEYLLNKNMPLLTTNAVVNQPTFQGYSNIYLNQEVKNSKPKAKEEAKKEVVAKTDKDGVNPRTSELFNNMIKEKKVKEENPQKKEDVKTDVNQLEDLFKKADEDTKAEVIFSLAEKFNVLDKYTSDESFSSENIVKTFNELISIAKKNNNSIDEIKKICGL